MSDKPVYERIVGDKVIHVIEMTFGKFRVYIGQANSSIYDTGWCYENQEKAVAAAETYDGKSGKWNGENEPHGWYRHPESGRRRPNGDPTKEYFRA